MKIKVGNKEYDIINAFNTMQFIDGASRESKQITVSKEFDLSIFKDNMAATLIYDDGTTEDLNEFSILGETHLKRANNMVWLCKQTTEELLMILLESYMG